MKLRLIFGIVPLLLLAPVALAHAQSIGSVVYQSSSYDPTVSGVSGVMAASLLHDSATFDLGNGWSGTTTQAAILNASFFFNELGSGYSVVMTFTGYTDSGYGTGTGQICEFKYAQSRSGFNITIATSSVILPYYSGDCNFVAGTYYQASFYVQGEYNGSYIYYFGVPSDGLQATPDGNSRWVGLTSKDIPQFLVYGNNTAASATVIDSVSPSNGSTVGTTTPLILGATGNILSTDYVSGTVLSVSYQSNGCQYAGVSVYTTVYNPCFSADLAIPIVASGPFSVSATTSPLSVIGGYTVVYSLTKPLFSVFGFNVGQQVITSTTTVFTVATSTLLDQLHSAVVTVYNSLASTTASVASVCNPLNFSSDFNIDTCVGLLFIPDQTLVNQMGTEFNNEVVVDTPISYVMDFYNLLSVPATSTASLPSLDITLPSSLPSNGGESFDLTPWGELLGPTSILSTATSSTDGKTLQQVVLPDWTIFVYITGAMIILREVLGIGGKVITS